MTWTEPSGIHSHSSETTSSLLQTSSAISPVQLLTIARSRPSLSAEETGEGGHCVKSSAARREGSQQEGGKGGLEMADLLEEEAMVVQKFDSLNEVRDEGAGVLERGVEEQQRGKRGEKDGENGWEDIIFSDALGVLSQSSQ